MPGAELPLVSIIVRSMARPELGLALDALLAQDYPFLDIVVVDATGGHHPPLDVVPRQAGHRLRLIPGTRQLPRAQAANAGIEAMEGELFGFLDDDDTVDTDHISGLVAAAAEHPDALCVYGRSRIVEPDGTVSSTHGLPLNRAIMYAGPLFHWLAALFRRQVLTLGCRFDERLKVSEDRDFIAQVASHGQLQFVDLCSFNYRPDIGTSGTGRGANRHSLRLTLDNALLQAKWAGDGVYHLARAGLFTRRAFASFQRGDRAGAKRGFEALLTEYPDDPNALNALARLALDGGALDEAARRAKRACEINPGAADYQLTLAYVEARRGSPDTARAAASVAMRSPAHRKAAAQLIAQLPPATVVDQAPPPPAATTPAENPTPPSLPDELHAAVAAMQRGEANTARELINRLQPEDLEPEACFVVASIYDELGDEQRWLDFLGRAPGNDPRVVRFAHASATRAHRPVRNASIAARVRAMLETFATRAQGDGPGRDTLHFVATFENIGGSERRATELWHRLSPHMTCHLWSAGSTPVNAAWKSFPICPIDPDRGLVPRGGTLVLLGTYIDASAWLDSTPFNRVIVAHNTDLPDELLRILVLVAENPSRPHVELTFPSALFRRWCDLEGLGRIEYPMVDTQRFAPRTDVTPPTPRLTLGRHGRDDRMKFHPNDPAFFRKLSAMGHTVRILGGTPLKPSFANDGDGAPTLLPTGSLPAEDFLASLDCFVYRHHPQLYETSGAAIMEAMAMALPVVVFDDRCGVTELIEHGRNGFLVGNEDEALDAIERLAADPALRRDIGLAARKTIIDLMATQDQALLSAYAGHLRGIAA